MHPDKDRLRAYSLGQVAVPDAADLERHLADCPTCCDAVEQARRDTFVDKVRLAARLELAPTVAPTPALDPDLAPTVAPAATEMDGGDTVPLLEHPRYRIVRQLGRGGMGTVYLAEHTVMGRQVALKVLDRSLTGKPELVERFQREVQAAAHLDHPNIVRAHDAEQFGETQFLVMEYVAGTDLAAYLAKKGPLPVHHACSFVRQAALGLQHAHEKGMVHRDLKPHNLMLTAKGQVKILDFGLAKLLRSGSGRGPGEGPTASGVVMGTPDYVAPEQANDSAQADVRSDVYSLGCTLYQLLTGRVPYPGDGLMDKLMAHATERPTAIAALRPGVPAELIKVVARMMHKAPARRYQTPAEVAQALAPFIRAPQEKPAVLAVAEARPSVTVVRRSLASTGRLPQRRRRPPGLLISALVAVALLGTAGLFLAYYQLRLETEFGTLVIESADPEIQVVVKQNGQVVEVVDPKANRKVELKPGPVSLELVDNGKPLQLDADSFALKRGEERIVNVKWVPKKDGGQARGQPDSSGTWRFQLGEPLVQPIFSPDSQLLYLGTKIRGTVYDLKTGQRRFTLVGGNARFTPEGKRILTVTGSRGQNDPLRLYDTATGKEVKVIPQPTVTGNFSLSPDGRLAATCGTRDGAARLWDMASGKLLKTWPQIGKEASLAYFPPNTPRLYVGYGHLQGKEVVRRWYDPATDQEEPAPSPEVIPIYEYSGTQILPGGREVVFLNRGDRTLRLVDLAAAKTLREYPFPPTVNPTWKTTHFSHDGHRLASVDQSSGTVLVLEVTSGKELARFESRLQNVDWLGFSQDGRWVAVTNRAGGVQVYAVPDAAGK